VIIILDPGCKCINWQYGSHYPLCGYYILSDTARSMTCLTVTCYFFTDYAIRLLQTNSSQAHYEGRVEIYHSGQWGTVCNSYQWSTSNSRVVCHELGYPDARTGIQSSSYGSGSNPQPVWLENVYCSGDEDSLIDCYYYGGWGSRYCNHTHDVGVSCVDRKCRSSCHPIKCCIYVYY